MADYKLNANANELYSVDIKTSFSRFMERQGVIEHFTQYYNSKIEGKEFTERNMNLLELVIVWDT